MRFRSRSSYAVRVPLLALLGALTLSACDSQTGPSVEGSVPETVAPATSPDAPSDPPSSPGTPSAPPSVTEESQEAAVLAAYQAYWGTYFRANQNPPQATYKDLEQVAVGAALETVRSSTFSYRETGRVFRRPDPSVVEHRAEIIELAADTATVRDCYLDDAWIETVATGERANEGAGTQLSTAQMVREGGAWKVSTLTVEESWEGVAGCAAG